MADKEVKEEVKEETPAVDEKKMTSRKFIVWLMWTILMIAIVVIGYIRSNDELTMKGLEYYFWISGIYIGGNVATKGIRAYFENKEAE